VNCFQVNDKIRVKSSLQTINRLSKLLTPIHLVFLSNFRSYMAQILLTHHWLHKQFLFCCMSCSISQLLRKNKVLILCLNFQRILKQPVIRQIQDLFRQILMRRRSKIQKSLSKQPFLALHLLFDFFNYCPFDFNFFSPFLMAKKPVNYFFFGNVVDGSRWWSHDKALSVVFRPNYNVFEAEYIDIWNCGQDDLILYNLSPNLHSLIHWRFIFVQNARLPYFDFCPLFRLDCYSCLKSARS